MATDFGRGIKAGIVASVIEVVIYAIILIVAAETVLGITGPYWTTIMAVFLVAAIIGAIIGGIIIGVIFAAVYGSLPSKSSIVKGIILGIIFWLINLVLSLGYIGVLAFLAVGFLLQVIVFGVLLGVFWDMFGGKKK